MPRAGGSGGGSRGGNSRGGGSRGGGSHGGGHHSHHSPHGHYGRDGLYISPFFFVLPLIIAFSMISMLMASVPDVLATLRYGGVTVYDEEAIRTYADAKYQEAFSDSASYEDNLLLVFLVAENQSDFAYLTWAGNHIDERITMMFGNMSSALGKALESKISVDSYENTLGDELAEVINTMERRVEAKNLDSSFCCDDPLNEMISYCQNESDLSLNSDELEKALSSFSKTTGISFVLAVDDMNEVFETEIPYVSLLFFTGGIILIGVLCWLTVALIKARKKLNDNHSEY